MATKKKAGKPPEEAQASTQIARREHVPVSSEIIVLLKNNPAVAYADPAVFEQLQRGAKMLSVAEFTPKDYQGSVPNCFGALTVAARMGLDVWEVMQNLYLVYGRMSWSTKFIIARMESTGRYALLDWKRIGDLGSQDMGYYYYGVLKERVHGEVVTQEGPIITMAMAKAAGWIDRKSQSGRDVSYWKIEPDLMLRYRAAARFASLYHPGATLGFLTREEALDIGPQRDDGADQARADQLTEKLRAASEGRIVEGEVIHDKPAGDDDPLVPDDEYEELTKDD